MSPGLFCEDPPSSGAVGAPGPASPAGGFSSAPKCPPAPGPAARKDEPGASLPPLEGSAELQAGHRHQVGTLKEPWGSRGSPWLQPPASRPPGLFSLETGNSPCCHKTGQCPRLPGPWGSTTPPTGGKTGKEAPRPGAHTRPLSPSRPSGLSQGSGASPSDTSRAGPQGPAAGNGEAPTRSLFTSAGRPPAGCVPKAQPSF